MSRRQLDCAESNDVRGGLRPLSSLTNYVRGEVVDPRLPAHTACTWGHDDGTEVLRDELDADGCRHYLLTDATNPEGN